MTKPAIDERALDAATEKVEGAVLDLYRAFGGQSVTRIAVEAYLAVVPDSRCEDCPPIGYPTDETRCTPCDRRALTVEEMPSAWQQRLKGRWHNLPEDWSKEECDRMPPGKVFRPLYAPDQLTRLCDQAKREAYAECLACQPSTAENPNEDAYQRGRFDGVMEFARNIVAKKALAEKKP